MGSGLKNKQTNKQKQPSESGSGYEERKGKRAEHVVLRIQTSEAPRLGGRLCSCTGGLRES